MSTVSDEEYSALLATLHESNRKRLLENNEIPQSVSPPQTMPKTPPLRPNDPYVEITEQPQSKAGIFSSEFINLSENCIHGESSTAARKTFPSIKVRNYEGPVVVVVSCVTKDDIPFCKPHPNTLFGLDCGKGVCTVKFKRGSSLEFPQIGIKRANTVDIRSNLKLRQDIRVDPFRTGFRHDIEEGDLGVVRLCFQVFLPDETGKFRRIVPPVVSHVIYDALSLILKHVSEDMVSRHDPSQSQKHVIEAFPGLHNDTRSLKPASVTPSTAKEPLISRITGVAGGSVSNSNTCGIQFVEGDVAINTYVKEEVPGVSCRIVQGDDSSVPHVKLSVPAKDGDSKVLVTCQDGEVKKWLYLHDNGSPEKARTKWTFRNVVHGLMEAILGESAESFCEFMDLLKTVYGCKLSKAYNHCLVLEFLHDNDEDAERMMKDNDNVKRLFTKFLKDIGKGSTDHEVEVSCEKVHMRTRRSDDGNIPSTSHSQEEDTLFTTSQTSTSSLLHRIKREAFSGVLHSSEWKKRVKREIHLPAEDPFEEDPPLKRKKSTQEEDGKCDKCDVILQQYRKSPLPERNIFILHLPANVIHDPEMMNFQTQEKCDECWKTLSALRNAEGGTLLLHLDSKQDTKLTNDRIMAFVHNMCKKVVVPGEVACDVFDVERDSHNNDVYILHTERADNIITVDFKTKIPGPTKYWDDTTPDELRPFLSVKRMVDGRKPELTGLDLTNLALNIVKLEYQQPDTPQTEQEVADTMLEDLFLAEHITACSKRRQGGSVFIGQPYNVKMESMVQGWDITGFDFEKGYEVKFRHVLQQAIEAHILVYNNPHSNSKLQARDVFEIGLHKLNEGFIVEVAVRVVNGCVFYDPKGPEAYKIDKGIKQRIPFDIWIDNFVNS